MKYIKYDNKYILRIDKNEEIINTIKDFCERMNITNGTISGIGSTNKVTFGIFNTIEKGYINKTLEGEMEITSLTGNISTKNSKIYLHIHINIANENLQVFGGHLNECFVSATTEIIINKINGFANRKFDDETGLNLYDFSV